MDKALLIYVGQTDFSYALAKKRDYTLKREPQIGFAYLAAVAAQQGVDVTILDMTIDVCTKEELVARCRKEAPLFVGFYTANAMKDRVIEHIRALREAEPALRVFVGGPDIYDVDNYLTAGGTAYCIGEGEKTIVDLISYCRGSLALPDIKGIAYCESGEVRHTGTRELIEDLDTLPIPAWNKYDLSAYHDFHVFDMRTPYTSIMASRGCPFHCGYCVSYKIWQNKLRRRSPEHVLQEIDYLVKELGVRYITFQDDIWSWNDDTWARTFCRGLLERKYDLHWRCILHPFSFKNSRREMLSIMREAGCTSITTGLQSADPRILKGIQRSPAEPESLAALIAIMKELGIINNTAFIFGLPGDDEESMEVSVRYALQVKPTFAAFYALSVLPGSTIAEAEQRGEFHRLPGDVVQRRCREAARRFYSNPAILWQIARCIMRTNPAWLLTAVRKAPYLLQLAGMESRPCPRSLPEDSAPPL